IQKGPRAISPTQESPSMFKKSLVVMECSFLEIGHQATGDDRTQPGSQRQETHQLGPAGRIAVLTGTVNHQLEQNAATHDQQQLHDEYNLIAVLDGMRRVKRNAR